MVFPSGDDAYVWVRREKEEGRTILNCGAREGDDVTDFLKLAADNGWLVIQDNDYDVITTGGIELKSGIHIRGDGVTSGHLVLTSIAYDEIFNPSKTERCWFKAEKVRFKATTCISDTPYVCGYRNIDSSTKLENYHMSECVLSDIGESSDMLFGYEFCITKLRNTIKLSKFMSDKIVASGRGHMRALIRTDCGYSNTEKPSKLQEIINKIKSSAFAVKLAIYGDSTVDGYNTRDWVANPVDSNGNAIGNTNHNLTSPNSWATQLNKKLKTINPSISVWNAGYGGRAIQDRWAINNYDAAITNNKYYGKPDFCFIAFGLNDMARKTWDPNEYKAKYIELINYIKSKGTSVIVISSDPTNRGDGGPSYEKYRDILITIQKMVAEETDSAYVDIFSYMSNIDSWTTLQSDGIHFGDLGNSKKSDFILDLFKRNNEYILRENSPRFGSSVIAFNKLTAYMPTGSNLDIAKFSGQINFQKIEGNHFYNTNINSKAEVDFFAGVSSSSVTGNTFKNLSSKFMSLSDSGGRQYLSTYGVSVVGNSWLFENGASNNYGVYFKPDISIFSGNTIRNNQSLPNDAFPAILIESNRGIGGYLGSGSPVGLVITSNVIDIQCYSYNNQYWRPIESPSVPFSSIISGNTFLGGELRELSGNNNIMSNNSFINVGFSKGVELRNLVNGNPVSKIKNGAIEDGRITKGVCLKGESGINTLEIYQPWLQGDTGEWTLQVHSVANPSNQNNWQTFLVTANPASQTVLQSSGRLAIDTNDVELKNIIFKLVMAQGKITLTSTGGTMEFVSISYKWVNAIR
ncbi:SGNH/GDSL hydrolase family protein [Xenorhabdus nematophila]|uniref:SGNH/GDSL hydrolase family protein n=1 Tax=Xenorhabdus nematophila TaxID=628 RepID=UPI0032B7DE0F